MKNLALLVILSLSLCGCATDTHQSTKPPHAYPVAKKNYPFVVKITNFFGAEGFGFDYFVDRTNIVVVVWNDFGKPAREILNRDLTQEETTELESYLAEFPLDTLKSDYTEPRVYDGLQRFFTFKIGDKEKSIVMRNVHVPELFALCEKVNDLVPKEMQMRGGGAAAISADKK
jgi:hypothetical protein